MSAPTRERQLVDLDLQLGLFERLSIQWPRLSVLRLHWVFGWALLANVVAWKAAGTFVGTTVAVQSSVAYMLLWVLLGVIVALYWMHRQWRERSRLPRSRSLTLAWSPGMGSVFVVMMLSPAWTGVKAADEHLRALRTKQELQEDMRVLGIVIGRGPRPMAQPGRSFPQAVAPTPRGGSSLGVHRGPYDLLPTRSVPGKNDIDVLSRYVSRERLLEARGCLEDSVECFEIWDRVRTLALVNVSTLAHAQRMPDDSIPPFSEEYYGLASLAAFAVVLGGVSGYLGVIRLRVIARTFVALLLLALTMERFSELAILALHRTPREIARGWFGVSWGIWVVVLVAVAFSLFRRRERDTLHDVGVLLVLLWPFFAVGTQVLFNFALLLSAGGWQSFSMIDRFYVHIFGVCGAVVILGFVMAWPLSWYRALPLSA